MLEGSWVKNLEKFFELNGYNGVSHGVIYNEGDMKEITFWDYNGKERNIKDIPIDVSDGIICFKEENGSLIICN